MGIRTVNGCCCFDLKTGVLIIGILGIVGSIGMLIQTPIDHSNACSGGKTPENNVDCKAASSRFGASIATSVIVLILMGLMIFGSQKENYRFMLPIIILQAITLVISIIAIWYIIVVFFIASAGMGVIALIVGNLFIVLSVYFWLVIYSRSEEIKAGGQSTGGYA